MYNKRFSSLDKKTALLHGLEVMPGLDNDHIFLPPNNKNLGFIILLPASKCWGPGPLKYLRADERVIDSQNTKRNLQHGSEKLVNEMP